MNPESAAACTSIERFLNAMQQWNASDLFVALGRPPMARVGGKLVPLDAPPSTEADLDEFLRILLPTAKRQQLDVTGDADVGYSMTDGRRFRFSVYRQRGGLSLVARALPTVELTFEQLNLPEVLATFCEQPRGLCLVTGATGSGKSTTMAAMVHRINVRRPAHIVTIEDPIEFVHRDRRARVTQREVGNDCASFSEALRHALRQSPDVVVVGELRDTESMTVALNAALTGHLVLATLHTNDAAQTLQRIFSLFPEHQRAQVALDLSLALVAVLSQRLLPKADGTGRVVACELLSVTPPAAKLIREQRVSELYDLMRAGHGADPGMVTFNHSLIDLLRKKAITYETGVAHATNADEFALAAKGMAVGGEAFKPDKVSSAAGLDMQALLKLAIDRKASDLHLAVGRPPIYRILGDLQALSIPALTAGDLRILLYSIMSARQRSTYELEREIDFSLQLETGQRFRVNAYYQKGSMAAALRAISTKIPDAGSLRIPLDLLRLAEREQGLILVVGPTGSGKSTTLACLIDRINKGRSCRIITVEDPIEYVHQNSRSTIDQREVNEDTLSFSKALKYVLRQDPDVILIGEMRDMETVSAAITAAETGHLVLATLHTNDAPQAVDRIIDSFPPYQQPQARSQLAAALLAVVSQRLLKRKGAPGLVAAFEVMVATPAIRTLIRDSKMHQALGVMETSKAEGMITMERSLKDMLAEGVIGAEEATRYMRLVRNTPI